MQSAIDQFQISIGRVRDLVALHNSIKAKATSALDVSDILRAALVLSVSALDYYIHEVVTLGMLEIYGGQRPEPTPSSNTTQSAFSRFQVSLGAARQDRIVAQDVASWLENEVQQNEGHAFLGQAQTISAFIPAISNSMNSKLSNIAWVEREIRERHSYQSFQQPDKIAEGIRLISDKKFWDEVAHKMGKPNRAKEIKQELSSIVDRRNKIAHEADIDPSYNIGTRWPIDEIQVDSAINFIQQVVESIHQVIV